MMEASQSSPWQIAGRLVNPRFVWLVDRVFADAISDPTSNGFRATDQVVFFPNGTFDIVTKFLRTMTADYESSLAIIFLFLGGDEICEDAPSDVSETVRTWFHKLGPRQIPTLSDALQVRDKYEAMTRESLSLFPSSSTISSNPPPRRSGNGFAMTRAVNASKKMRCQGSRHHHFSQLQGFHGQRQGRGHWTTQGGQLPVYDRLFEEDGIRIKHPPLTGVVVRANMFVEGILGIDGQKVHPAFIDGLTMAF